MSLQAEAGWSGDVPAMSEHLLASLLVLAGEVAAAIGDSSSQAHHSKSAGRSRKASHGKAHRARASIIPIDYVLQQLHPLFFATPPSAFGGCCSHLNNAGRETMPWEVWQEHQQKLQLGAVVQARLVGCLQYHADMFSRSSCIGL
jgi:hypothetical protein